MKRYRNIVGQVVIFFMLIVFVPNVIAKEDMSYTLSLQEAVEVGLENSIHLEQVKNEIDLANLSKKRAEYTSKKLDSAKKRLQEGTRQLREAQDAFAKDISPQDILLPDGTVIKQGTSIGDLALPDAIKDNIRENISNVLESKKSQLNSGDLKIITAVQDGGALLSDQLDYASLDSLSIDSTRDLMTTMSRVAFEVTQASYDIYKNQIALLIQKNYYDVLQAQKIVEMKQKAFERGKKQYEFSKAGYEEGMKSKDDMLLAQLYYRSTELEYTKSLGEFRNAQIELKKSLNIPQESKLELTDALIEEVDIFDEEEGLVSGFKNRLEIKKALGELIVYNLNYEETIKKYPSNTFQHKEANLLKQKSILAFDRTKLEAESIIRQSYQTVLSMGDMLETSKDLISYAKESVEIAEYKYKEGFGVETSLLKKLDIESSAGTIVEVLAAEENLAQIEEKVVQIMYSYNLARMKYLNDIGHFIY